MTQLSADIPISPRAAFQYRDFRFYIGARFLLTLAVMMQSVAVGWQVYDITRDPLDLGYVGLIQFLPALLLVLPAGHVADRFDRRLILLGCVSAQLLCALLLLALAQAGTALVWPIYAVLLLFGTARAFMGPAAQSLVPLLVPKQHFSNAVAWGSSVWQVAVIAGPALGGLLFTLGASAVYAAAAALFAIAATGIAAMGFRRAPAAAGEAPRKGVSWQEVLAGVHYVRSRRLILGAISLDLFAVLFGGATALLPVFARDILHAGPGALGLLRSAPAVGAALMAVWLAYHPLRRHAGRWLFLCVGLFGLATILFGLSTDFRLSLAALSVLGAADMVSMYMRQTLVQIATPDAMRGRVSAVNLIFIGASNELGEFESGLTAAWFGAVPAVVIGGLGTLLVVGLWSVLFPELRRVDRLDAPEEESRAG